MVLFYYFGFKSISGREQFQIMNISNDKYYLDIVSGKNMPQYGLKKYEQINDIKYFHICKSGKYKLNGARPIFQCERNDNVSIELKLKNIFHELKIIDENDNIIWDLKDENWLKNVLTNVFF
jgi:hypothetical protein